MISSATMLAFGRANWKPIAIVVALLSVFIWHKAQVHSAYKQGGRDAVAKIEQANKASGAAADKQGAKVDDCPLGRWNREKHKCEN